MKSGSAEETKILKWISEKAKEIAAAEKVLLFGSRARGDALERSDFDIAIVTNFPEKIELIKEEAENCPHTLLSFDIVDFKKTSGEFKKRILAESIEI